MVEEYRAWERLEMAEKLTNSMVKKLMESFKGEHEYKITIERSYRGCTVVNIRNSTLNNNLIHIQDWKAVKDVVDKLLKR